MHPFMPFVTEELWQQLPFRKQENARISTIMLQPFPKLIDKLKDRDSEVTIAALKSVIEAIRNFRGENNISPKVELKVKYFTQVTPADAFLRTHADDIEFLAKISSMERTQEPKAQGSEAVIPVSNPPIEFRIDLTGLVNVDEEAKRIQKEIEKVNADIAHVSRKLSQETFIAKAPPELVAKEKKKEQELIAKRSEFEAALKRLSQLAR
jgi:valyl-tRNA synthetase